MKIRQRPWQQDLGKAAARFAGVAAMLTLSAGRLLDAVGAGQSFAVALPEMEGPVTMGIFSPSGERVRLLYRDADISTIPAGLNGLIMTWDGKDDRGVEVPAGTYKACGLVHGSVSVSAIPVREAAPTLPSEPFVDCALPGYRPPFPPGRITVRAARDELLETRPLLSIDATLDGGNRVTLGAEGLPLLSLEDAGGGVLSATLTHGSRPGTAILTLHNAKGSTSYTIGGLDRLVPLNAGGLEIAADAFHPLPSAGEFAP